MPVPSYHDIEEYNRRLLDLHKGKASEQHYRKGAVIADLFEEDRKHFLLTTNLEFSRWGSIFTDDQMAAAMIDRLAHHGHLILFEGNSYRMEHALMKQTARQPKIEKTA